MTLFTSSFLPLDTLSHLLHVPLYLPQGKGLIDHFQQSMGCIEILGKSGRIERVYFEVKESYRKQWEETQIQVGHAHLVTDRKLHISGRVKREMRFYSSVPAQESKRAFLRSVETGSQKTKLQGFINFCEDTIFEVSRLE